MTTRNLLMLLAVALAVPISLLAADPKVAWHFDLKDDDNGIPRGKLFLDVDGKRQLINDHVTGNYHTVDKADYKKQKIPTEALTACRGSWAHAIMQFYVVSKDGKLQIFMRDEDGESRYVGEYELVKTIPQ
ncbi:MAG: hypothetical protein JNJ83_04845 [Verrucomicrobiaceae bacterium]|nr:hypothetical protein [Verrucomicrobiaceae bacterium]